METIRALIQRLQQQSDQQAVPSELLATVHELESALRQAMTAPVRQVKSGNISVVMPSGNRIHTPQPTAAESKPPVAQAPAQEVKSAPPVQRTVPDEETRFAPVPREVPVEETRPAAVEEFIPAPVKVPEFRKPDESRIVAPEPSVAENFHLSFAKEEEAKKQQPAQQMEMNDIFSQTFSLNDQLRADHKEVGTSLHDEPVKDLRRAIGINDRFVYLSELFRGDEVMYERSLKTINNFRIYPEAEYWIERELKVKLGWDENKETVKQFRSLVRRRFMV